MNATLSGHLRKGLAVATVLLLLLYHPFAQAQEKDSVYRLEAMPAVQVSDMLKLSSGVAIEDYGGVDGMKTVSVRGFDSPHTTVCYDGIVVSDCQTGQIDLSKFSLQNSGNVELVTGSDNSIFVPARSAASASTITLNTQVPPHPVFSPFQRSDLPFNVDFRFTGGSFGLINPAIVNENRILCHRENPYSYISSSLNINYLQSKGDYPFLHYYGSHVDSTSAEVWTQLRLPPTPQTTTVNNHGCFAYFEL